MRGNYAAEKENGSIKVHVKSEFGHIKHKYKKSEYINIVKYFKIKQIILIQWILNRQKKILTGEIKIRFSITIKITSWSTINHANQNWTDEWFNAF